MRKFLSKEQGSSNIQQPVVCRFFRKQTDNIIENINKSIECSLGLRFSLQMLTTSHVNDRIFGGKDKSQTQQVSRMYYKDVRKYFWKGRINRCVQFN